MTVTMAITRVGLLTLAIFMLTIGQGSALRCWTCSSTKENACHDPFNKTYTTIVNCEQLRSTNTQSYHSTAVCKKLKFTENGKVVTTRQCDWINDDMIESGDVKRQGACPFTSLLPHRKVDFCEICTEDSCNGSNRDVIASTWCAFVPLIIYLCSKKNL